MAAAWAEWGSKRPSLDRRQKKADSETGRLFSYWVVWGCAHFRPCYIASVSATTASLARYRARLRTAAAIVMAVRIIVAAGAVGLAAFVLVAWVLGPMTPIVWLCVGWGAVFAMAAVAVAWSLQPLKSLHGHGALGLVADEEPALLSPLQSAYELQEEHVFSRELVVAQRLGVLRALEHSPARKFIPWRWVVQPAFAGAIFVGVIAWWSLGLDRAAAGRYAMLHGEGAPVDGVRGQPGCCAHRRAARVSGLHGARRRTP